MSVVFVGHVFPDCLSPCGPRWPAFKKTASWATREEEAQHDSWVCACQNADLTGNMKKNYPTVVDKPTGYWNMQHALSKNIYCAWIIPQDEGFSWLMEVQNLKVTKNSYVTTPMYLLRGDNAGNTREPENQLRSFIAVWRYRVRGRVAQIVNEEEAGLGADEKTRLLASKTPGKRDHRIVKDGLLTWLH